MRRRTLALAVPLGLIGLAACDRDGSPGPVQMTDHPPQDDLDPAPVLLDGSADPVDVTELRLPLEMTPMIVVDPGWTAAPVERDGIFLGYSDAEDQLRFRAVDQDGTLLWEALRPLSCTGHSLSAAADGTAIAVLADATGGGDAPLATTVTGYDLRTAEERWGPVEVPGPQAAHGLVFAVAEESPMGSSSSRTALAAETGEVALTDQDLDGGRILAEHGGVVLHTLGPDLVAASTVDGSEQWRVPLPDALDPARVGIGPLIDPSTGFAVLGDGRGPGVVVDLADGRVVADDADHVAQDHVLDVTVVASGRTVRGLDPEGAETWAHEDPEQLTFLTAGERLVYAVREEEGTLVVLDTSRGLMVHPFDVDQAGPLAVPEVFSADTAAAVNVGDEYYLVTTEFDEDYGTR